MDSDSSESTDSEGCQMTKNNQFNQGQIELLMICLKGIIEKVVKVIQSNRNNKIVKIKRKKKAKHIESGNVANKKVDRFRKDVHELCNKIHDISSSASHAKPAVPGNSKRDAEAVLPGTSKTVTESSSHAKTDVENTKENSSVAMLSISKSHIQAAPMTATPPHLVSSTSTKAESNSTSKSTALSDSSSHSRQLASEPSRTSMDILVPETVKRLTETEVIATTTMSSASPKTLRSCIVTAVPEKSRGVSKAAFFTAIESMKPTITTGDIEAVTSGALCPIVQPQPITIVPKITIPTLVLRPATQISLVEVKNSDIQISASEAVAKETHHKTQHSTAKESDIEVGAGTPIRHAEANRAEIPISVAKFNKKAVFYDIARYDSEKVSYAPTENCETRAPDTTSATKEIVTATSTDHRQIIELGNSNHNEKLKKECDRITRINDGARVGENKKKKHNSNLITSVNEGSSDNKELNDRNVNLKILKPKMFNSIANNQVQENTKRNKDINTNPNLKRTRAPSNNLAKRPRIDHKCMICSKLFQFEDMEEHYKKEHNIHHEIKHNSKYYEHKIQDLDNRCNRRASTYRNINEEPIGRQERNKNVIESRDSEPLELDITASNVHLEPIVNFTCDRITDTDRNMTSMEERNIICVVDAIDLTSDDNDESEVMNKAAPEAKPVEDDQILNENEIINLSDDVLMYDIPEDKDRSIKTDTSSIEMNNNIENNKNDVKEDPEMALAEEFLIANVKNERAKEQKDEDDDEKIVESVFFNRQPDNKKSGEKRKQDAIENRRDRHESHSNRKDKIKGKSSKQKIENYVKNIILTSALIANNNGLEVTVSDPSSTSALQIQKDQRETVEKQKPLNNTTKSQPPTVSSSQSVSSVRSLPIPISSSLSLSVIPNTSAPVSKSSSNTESLRKNMNAKQSAENVRPQTAQISATLTPKRDSASKSRKHKKKCTTTQNTTSIDNVSDSKSRKLHHESASAQNSSKHTSKGKSDSKSRKHENNSTSQNTGGNLLDVSKPLSPKASYNQPSTEVELLRSIPVIQFGTNVTSTTALFSLPSTSSAASVFTNPGPSTLLKSPKHSSERPAKPKHQNVKEKPGVNSTYAISPNISFNVSTNPSKRTEPSPLQPTLPQSGTNMPPSTSQSMLPPIASTAMSQFSSKPTNTTPLKSSNELTDSRLSKLTQQSFHPAGSNKPSTAHSTPTSFASPSSKSNPTSQSSSKHVRQRDSVPSISQISASSNLNLSASRIRSPSTDSRPAQLNSVSSSSRRASMTNVGHSSSNSKYKQLPQTSWHTPVPVEIEPLTHNISHRPVSVSRPNIEPSVSNPEPRANLPSQPIITPRSHSTLMGNLTTPTIQTSWHIPEDRPGIDTRPDQRPEIHAPSNLNAEGYLSHAGIRDPDLFQRLAVAYGNWESFFDPKRKK